MANTSQVASLARAMMNVNGLSQWRFEFDRSTKRFGVCKYASRTIGLSEKLTRANDIERCKETILHEIAHALAGSQAGHGPVWVRQARALGIKGERCFTGEDTTLVGHYFGYCERCGDRPVSSRVQTPSPGYICKKHRKLLIWKDRRGNVVTPVERVRKVAVYTMTCSACGMLGTTTKSYKAPKIHRGCGFTVTFKKSLDISAQKVHN